jgi:hypothetical protein
LLGFTAFGAWKTPPIQQPETQLAGLPLQTSPVGQFAFSPSVLVHAVVPPVPAGRQLWHGFPAGVTLGATHPMPPMQQPATQLAGLPLQTSPDGQLTFGPSVLVHADVLAPG